MMMGNVAKFPTRLMGMLLLCTAIGACSTLSVPGAGDLLNDSNATATTPTAERPKPDARGVISYPGYQVAVARGGDTVTTVAQRLGLDAGALADKNGLPVDTRLRNGELLILPGRVPEAAATGGSVDVATLAGSALDRAEGKPATSSITPAPGPEPRRHTVGRGETAYSIARRYNISVQSLADWNGLDSQLTVRLGQTLLIPPATGAAPERPAETSAPGTGSTTPVPPSAATPQPETDLAPVASAPIATETVEPAPAAQQQTKSSDTAALLQPVTGRIIRGYSPGKNEGLDFGAAAGASVRAADAGTVAAITKDTEQVPILVLRHEGNLLTVYANVEDIVVEKGTRVTRGQKIAKVRAGDNPFLHFEVRKGFESVDPVPYLSN